MCTTLNCTDITIYVNLFLKHTEKYCLLLLIILDTHTHTQNSIKNKFPLVLIDLVSRVLKKNCMKTFVSHCTYCR